MSSAGGRHFLQIPGPTNVPERVLRAVARPTIDHRGPEFARLAGEILEGMKDLFHNPDGDVMIFPASGSGAWEAALANTLSPGDRVLMFDHGFFARGWHSIAERLGLDVDMVPGDWQQPVDPTVVEERLRAEGDVPYRAVAVVHSETSTGVRSDIAAIRAAIDAAGHGALLLVDAVSSLASMALPQDEWGIDVVVTGSQKGLMLPPGLSFNSVSAKAFAASADAELPRAYWDWEALRTQNARGFFPYTPATNLLFGLSEALTMLREEGEAAVFARHDRLAAATRAAVQAWGLEIYCADPANASSSLTAVVTPEGSDADQLRQLILDRFDMSLGTGLGPLQGKLFRIGHLGEINELALAGALGGVEMGLQLAGVPFRPGGVTAALESLAATVPAARTTAS
ncbi:MAG TPA: aminotransferase class V-fold PLP-dependent enzyme [Acidobacteriota bacterium]|nr:aminotransferase class V-fold PLP-dependent enzyme [Acidobacteriota bacterium]